MRACKKMKNSKVYSASDFSGVGINVVDDGYWTVDYVTATKAGQHSKLPLFEVQLKKLNIEQKECQLPAGFMDCSEDMVPNRTYYVREGRTMYNALANIWQGLEGDMSLFPSAAMKAFWQKDAKGKPVQQVYRGHVVRLTGVNYTKLSRDKESVISRSSLELWYPTGMEPEVIVDDFVRLCNRGVYTPILPDPAEKQDPLKDVDPKIIAAVMAALGK